MRDFITYPTKPTFANPACRQEFHPPDQDEWEREVAPVIEWILAGCHLAPFPHPLLTAHTQKTFASMQKPYRGVNP